jgi:hypothetical protein
VRRRASDLQTIRSPLCSRTRTGSTAS